ncbi:MAG: hypothetical protein LUE98_07715 [Tannerellaceae bacterium]|nr:hypothetical protein [Tannerellaceae bacterium]
MAKRLIWTDESLNCYGFWLLTEGGDLSDFKKNPIMLYNHHRTWSGKTDEILPIGVWEDYKVEGGVITGSPRFDLKDDFAKKIAGKVEGGFLKACSVGIRILEVSEDPKYLKPGQTRPTVVKWKLKEVSIVDIPVNPNAAGIVLYDANDNVITLSESGNSSLLPLLNKDINKQNSILMKSIALQFGLKESASESEILLAFTKLKSDHQAEVAAITLRATNAETALKDL